MKFFNKFKRKKSYVDAIIDLRNVIDNPIPIYLFFDNVISGKSCELRILTYSTEREPIIRHIIYNSNSINFFLNVISDVNPVEKTYIGNKFIKEKKGEYMCYDLYKDDKFLETMLKFII